MRFNMADAQANLQFLRSQQTHVEPGVYATQYPTVQYPDLVPVDFSAPEFSLSVTYVSTDGRGRAQWINGNSKDIPLVGTSRSESQTPVYTSGIGYDYGWEELGFARMMGQNITAERAETARRVSEEFVDVIVFEGDASKGFESMIDNSAITPVDVADGSVSADTEWEDKLPLEVIKDVNEALIDTWSDSLQIEMADTVVLPPTSYAYIASQPVSADNPMTILELLLKTNIYTMKTGQRLTVTTCRQLETAGVGPSKRMVTYTRRPDVVKLHVPMSHRFLEAQQDVMHYIVPGVMRIGGVDIRRPGAFRYRDGI